jgi:hypothetical protein
MKLAAFLIILAVLYHLFYPSKEENVSHYQRFREQYSHNLKSPLVKHYRDLSCEPSKEMGLCENETKELSR